MATTMQEYLEEVARRQATGWTPGVQNMPRVSTTWNLPSTARTTMRQAVPKTNIDDVRFASNTATDLATAEKKAATQRLSDKNWTGTVKSITPMLGAISKIAGPAAFLYDALRPSQVAMADVPTDVPGYSLADPTVTWSPDQGAAINEAKVQELAGTQTGMPVAMDASPNIMDPLNDVQPITDFIAEVPTVTTDQDYLNLGVTPPGWDIAHPAQSPLLDQRYLEQPDKQTVTQDVTQAATGTTGLGHTGGKTTAPFATDFLSGTVFPALTGEPFGPYNEAQKTVEDWKGLGLIDDWDAGVMKGHQLATVGAVPGSYTNTLGGGLANTVFSGLQPLDQVVDEWGTANPLASAWRGAVGGTANLVGQMFGPPDTPVTAAYELMNQGVRPASHFAMDEQGVMAPALREMVTQVDEFSPLASPDITAQATIDDYDAVSMGKRASHPGQGGYIGDTERTIGEHLAAVNERVQAMPEVSVPAPTAPTVAAVAAQDRLAQQQADAVMRRAAQQAAAQDAARQAAQRAAVQADIAAAQAEQDRIRQANALMNSKSYQESGLDGLSAAERDIVAAAQVDTFAGIERQIRGDSDTAGERSAGMGGGRGGFAGPDRW